MLPFPIDLKAGVPITEQILFAVKKAVVSGQLAPGIGFPSVRQLSQELRINPNTAHRVVTDLADQGLLVTTPGVGSVVAPRQSAGRRERAELLGPELEKLAVEARKLGLALDEVQAALALQWRKLGP
ncbi:MAG: GntR family transcriptional regulator [Opitutaceae bacterium]